MRSYVATVTFPLEDVPDNITEGDMYVQVTEWLENLFDGDPFDLKLELAENETL